MERECGRCFCLLNKDCKYTCIKMNMSTHMDSINPFIIPIVWWLREYACVHVHCMLCRNELLSHHSVWLSLLCLFTLQSVAYMGQSLSFSLAYRRDVVPSPALHSFSYAKQLTPQTMLSIPFTPTPHFYFRFGWNFLRL